MKELSIWIVAGFLVFLLIKAIADRETPDPIGQALICVIIMGLYALALLGRIVSLFIMAWQ